MNKIEFQILLGYDYEFFSEGYPAWGDVSFDEAVACRLEENQFDVDSESYDELMHIKENFGTDCFLNVLRILFCNV